MKITPVLSILVTAAVVMGSMVLPGKTNATTCSSQTLKYGSKGTCVTYLQNRLRFFKCNLSVIDGKFYGETVSAVKTFQTENALLADGIVGPRTWSKLLLDYSADCMGKVSSARQLCIHDLTVLTQYPCMVIHNVNGKYRLEIITKNGLYATVVINVPRYSSLPATKYTYISFEKLNSYAKENTSITGNNVEFQRWAPGAIQVNYYGKELLMGDPHKFSTGQNMYWRVAGSAWVDLHGRPLPDLINGKAHESYYYTGKAIGNGFEVPKWFIDKYDDFCMQVGAGVIIRL